LAQKKFCIKPKHPFPKIFQNLKQRKHEPAKYELPENADEILEIRSSIKKRFEGSLENFLFNKLQVKDTAKANKQKLFENTEEELILQDRESYIDYITAGVAHHLPKELTDKP
jgi:hypothetical protein